MYSKNESSHTSPSSESELEFVDISVEEHREYVLASGDTYRIEKPVALFVREESGNHRVLARRDDGKYVSHHIPGDGRRPIKWVVQAGEPFFLGWGTASAEATPAPLTQPESQPEIQPEKNPDSRWPLDLEGSFEGDLEPESGPPLDAPLGNGSNTTIRPDGGSVSAEPDSVSYGIQAGDDDFSLQVRGRCGMSIGTYESGNFGERLREALGDIGGSATIKTSAQGFILEDEEAQAREGWLQMNGGIVGDLKTE